MNEDPVAMPIFVIPGKPSATRNPVIIERVSRLRRDDVWIPAFAGMTPFMDFLDIAAQPLSREMSVDAENQPRAGAVSAELMVEGIG